MKKKEDCHGHEVNRHLSFFLLLNTLKDLEPGKEENEGGKSIAISHHPEDPQGQRWLVEGRKEDEFKTALDETF